jgi:hypothetical protein
VREVVLICSFVKADAVRPRGSAIASAPRLFLRVEMQAAHQVSGFVVEGAKLVRRRLLVWCCIIKSVPCATQAGKIVSHLVAACHSTRLGMAKSDPKHSSCAHRPPAAAPVEQCAQRAPPAPAGTGRYRTAAATSRYYYCME